MRRTLLLTVALALALGAGAVAYALSRGDAGQSATSWHRDSCRDAVAATAYAGAIAHARPLVSRLKAAFGAPGLQLAVAVDGRVVWSRLCGFASLETPTTRTTLFRIGSVSKVLTATALARLVQAGEVDLDAEVQTYVPSFPRKDGRLTIAQLASHRAGIRHYDGSEVLNTKHYVNVAAGLSVFADDPLVFRPGSGYSYSSYGFNLLGAALERAAEAPFAGLLREKVLAPLGLTHTGLDLPGLRDRATLYEVRADRRAAAAPKVDLSDRYPSGGLVGTAEDLARLGSKLGDPAFLTPTTQSTFFSEQRPASGRPTGYGLGFEVGRSPLGRFVGHTGNVVGGTAFLLAHPQSRVAIAMATNIGWVTVAAPPRMGPSVPDPPRIVLPFIEARRVRQSGAR